MAPVSKTGGCKSPASSNLAPSSIGRMAEWIKASRWKREEAVSASEGSNPSSTSGDTMSRSKNSRRRYALRHLHTSLSLKSNECDDSKVLKKMSHAVHKKATWGQTTKILRRNARLWQRQLGKARRRADHVVIEAQLEEGT